MQQFLLYHGNAFFSIEKRYSDNQFAFVIFLKFPELYKLSDAPVHLVPSKTVMTNGPLRFSCQEGRVDSFILYNNVGM